MKADGTTAYSGLISSLVIKIDGAQSCLSGKYYSGKEKKYDVFDFHPGMSVRFRTVDAHIRRELHGNALGIDCFLPLNRVGSGSAFELYRVLSTC
jgi:hypothetical protein